MTKPSDSRTPVTLLGRLAGSAAPDQAAWAEFVERYGAKIYRWCRRGRLQEADARDVTQQVLLKLSRRLKRFTYDPQRSFRAWLKTVTYHALSDFAFDQQRPGRGSGDSQVLEWLLGVEARESLMTQLEEEFDRELLEEAMRRVRLRVAPHTWEAFRLTALAGVPAAEVARRLHMKVANVYKARSNVLSRLQEERQWLEQAQGLPDTLLTPDPNPVVERGP